MGITFGDEPPRDNKWQPIADACRERPGEWGHVDLDIVARGYTSIVRQGRMLAFRPAGSFEAKTVSGKLWIRYVGHVKPQGEQR